MTRLSPLILFISRLLFFVIMLFVLLFFLHGHVSIGGSLLSGLLCALTFVFFIIILPEHDTQAMLRYPPIYWVLVGLFLCLGMLTLPLTFNQPFGTLLTTTMTLPLVSTTIHYSSSFFLNVGLFLVMAGSFTQFGIFLCTLKLKGASNND